MRVKLMVLGAVGLIALSAGVPAMLNGGGQPSGAVHHAASLSVEVMPDENMVVATLVLDPKAPVMEVSLGSDVVGFAFTQVGIDGVWIAEAQLAPGIDCYPVEAQVTLATLQAGPIAAVGKVKKAKKAKKAKIDKVTGQAKPIKLKKSKAAPASVGPVFGATVLELMAESCVAPVCPEIMN